MEKNFFQPFTFIGMIFLFLIKGNAQKIANYTANADVNVKFCNSSVILAGSASGNVGAFSPAWIL